ncbi:MAG: HD domain-containing protein [bacterium]|nr:HD domain-containing protein [bacterium]
MNDTNPPPDLSTIFQLADELEILQRLPRTGFVMSGVTNPQTVAAHSFAVAVWALLLLERLPDRHSLDSAKILLMCILHEFAETRLGDIPQPARHLLGPDSVAQAERTIVDDMLAHLPSPWRSAWHEFDSAQSREARIVKAADKLELMHRILVYERQNNGSFHHFWQWQENFRDAGIPEAQELFDELKRRHALLHHSPT